MKLHPLINPESSHYQSGGKVAIEEMEKILTVFEMIGYCKGNIFKYEFRKELKGALEADEKKIETYKNYQRELEDMLYLSLGNHKVCDAIKLTRREWAWKAGYGMTIYYEDDFSFNVQVAKFTAKQQQVFDLILDGYTYPQIATELGLTIASIKKHAQAIFIKHNEPHMHALVCNWYKDQLHYALIRK